MTTVICLVVGLPASAPFESGTGFGGMRPQNRA